MTFAKALQQCLSIQTMQSRRKVSSYSMFHFKCHVKWLYNCSGTGNSVLPAAQKAREASSPQA